MVFKTLPLTEQEVLKVSLKILIVDDQLSNVQLLEELLSDAGYKNVTATLNPTEVCALHRQHQYDLILLDLQMPRMDGFKLISALREGIDTKDIPIAIISHLGREKDHARAKKMGVENFIVQGSMTPREVVDKIKNIIAASSSFQIGFDYFGWDAPALAKKMELPGLACHT